MMGARGVESFGTVTVKLALRTRDDDRAHIFCR